MTINGVAGSSRVSGHIITNIDLGKEVVLQDLIFVIPSVTGGRKLLLGKLYLAMLDATMSVRNDYLYIPTSSGFLAIIEVRHFLGNGRWEEKPFSRSPMGRLDALATETYRCSFADTQEQDEQKNSVYLQDESGKKVHPWRSETLSVNAVTV